LKGLPNLTFIELIKGDCSDPLLHGRDFRMFQLPKFRQSALLDLALTHRSYCNEHPRSAEHNERLEFLGDALLNFLSGEFLYHLYPDKTEGELTPLRASLVDETQLAQFANWIDLGNHIKLSRGAELEGGRQNPNLLSSTFEAVIGAYFLDCKSEMDPVREYVQGFFVVVVDLMSVAAAQVNYKSRFQEWALANMGENPKYVIADQSGPDHAREFMAEVYISETVYGTGKGYRKQNAEKDAARDALRRLGLIDDSLDTSLDNVFGTSQ
jgi:ribonuclease III